jgi:ADP-heptose:LPS heptosyltransferase
MFRESTSSGRVLIYRRGGLGDTLLTFPVAEILTRKGFKVDFVGNTDYLKLAKEVGFIENVFSDFPNDLSPYGEIILFAGENFLKVPAKVIKPFPQKREHITVYYLKSLGLEKYPFSEELPLKPLKGLENKVILHPGSGSPKKNPPLEFYKNLYLRLEKEGFEPLMVLGEAEYHLKERLKGFNLYTVEDLLTFARLLKSAKAFIGNDSGFSHLAGYLGVKTVVLFGPTDPIVWKPLGKNVKVLYKGLECSPCFPKVCKEKPCLHFEMEKVLKELKGE